MIFADSQVLVLISELVPSTRQRSQVVIIALHFLASELSSSFHHDVFFCTLKL
jgi:hypothetical protein